MTQIQGLDALILIVKDLDKQKDFYKNILGLEIEADYGGAVFFKLGNQKINRKTRQSPKKQSMKLENKPSSFPGLIEEKTPDKPKNNIQNGFNGFLDKTAKWLPISLVLQLLYLL